MKKFIKDHRFLTGLLSVFISVFLVSIVAYGATTIGTNIQTAGTSSSTSATTTDYLYVGVDITEPAGIDFTGGDLIVSGNAYFAAKATSTTAFAVGSGTINNLDMAGGDLYVLDGAEIDGGLWADSATTTDSLAIGGYASSTGNLNTQGNLHVGGTASVDGAFTFGTSTTPISVVLFGSCDVDFSNTLAKDEASSTDCTATGVVGGDKVFVTPSWLEAGIVFQAASSSANNIRIFVRNATTTAVTTGTNSWSWMTIH